MDFTVIDCSYVTGPESLHDALKVALDFPDYYGKNLDALFDCLTDIQSPVHLVLAHFNALGDWTLGFRAVFADAATENPLLTVKWD